MDSADLGVRLCREEREDVVGGLAFLDLPDRRPVGPGAGGGAFTNSDRWFFVQLYRWFPSILEVLTVIRPETLVRWRRAGFRRYWRWKSRPRGGRPQIEIALRGLIRQMSMENLLWGAPRIHGELLKLGFEVAQSTVAKYGHATWTPKSGKADLSAKPR